MRWTPLAAVLAAFVLVALLSGCVGNDAPPPCNCLPVEQSVTFARCISDAPIVIRSPLTERERAAVDEHNAGYEAWC